MFSRALLIEGAFQRTHECTTTDNFIKSETDAQKVQWNTFGDLDKYTDVLLVEAKTNE